MVLEAFQASLTFKKWVCVVTLSTSDSSQAWKRNRGVMSQGPELDSLFNSLNPRTHADAHTHALANTVKDVAFIAGWVQKSNWSVIKCGFIDWISVWAKILTLVAHRWWSNSITQDACACARCPQAAEFYFRSTMLDLKGENSISKVWGLDLTGTCRASTNSSWSGAVWER